MSDNKGRSGGGHGFVKCEHCTAQFPSTETFATPTTPGAKPIELGHHCASFMVMHEAGMMLVAIEGSQFAMSLFRFREHINAVMAPICDVCIQAFINANAVELIERTPLAQ